MSISHNIGLSQYEKQHNDLRHDVNDCQGVLSHLMNICNGALTTPPGTCPSPRHQSCGTNLINSSDDNLVSSDNEDSSICTVLNNPNLNEETLNYVRSQILIIAKKLHDIQTR